MYDESTAQLDRMANPTLTLRHEIDEARAVQRMRRAGNTAGPGFYGHYSPSVIQQEAGHLNFMPPQTQQSYTNMRVMGGEAGRAKRALTQRGMHEGGQVWQYPWGPQNQLTPDHMRRVSGTVRRRLERDINLPLARRGLSDDPSAWYRRLHHPDPKVRNAINTILQGGPKPKNFDKLFFGQ